MEYIALCETTSELKWIRTYLAELGFDVEQSTLVFCDNTASISWTSSSESVKRAKHIGLNNHFGKHVVESGQVKVIYIDSDKNESDGFTKPLRQQKFD